MSANRSGRITLMSQPKSRIRLCVAQCRPRRRRRRRRRHAGAGKSAATNNAVIQTRVTAVVKKFIIPLFMTAAETHNVEEAAICFPVVPHRNQRSLRALLFALRAGLTRTFARLALASSRHAVRADSDVYDGGKKQTEGPPKVTRIPHCGVSSYKAVWLACMYETGCGPNQIQWYNTEQLIMRLLRPQSNC